MAEKARYLNRIELGFLDYVSEQQTEYKDDIFSFYNDEEVPDKLADTKAIVSDLESVDWAFTSDKTGFLTHDIHPYPAKFIPQIPGHIIARLSLRGELVFDPFGGSGTTALEAIRLGRRALSMDANPVATLIGKVKTCNIDRAAATDLHAIRSGIITRLFDLPQAEQLCTENSQFIPEIANIDKWFPLSSRGELAFIRSRIAPMESDIARNIAMLALSRIILAVSFQDSETRYSSKPRHIPQGETLKRYLGALDEVVRNIFKTQSAIRYGVSSFITGDARELGALCKPDSVDLIVTSPPYGNAYDYHLYHRFRLLWLGHDPRKLAKIEVGSHLRHQKEASGFDSYISEMAQSLVGMRHALKTGRYAILVIGDAIYNGNLYHGAESVSNVGERLGFKTVCIIERKIHSTKRSFVVAGRRANTEKLLIFQKPPAKVSVLLKMPPYKLWPYETLLQRREIEAVLGVKVESKKGLPFSLSLDPYNVANARRLVFTHGVGMRGLDGESTWQAIIENGFAYQPSARKDPKYVTHGLHPYKGKFYPQLAKGLMNLCGLKSGAKIFDPFCGSGTTLLEGFLNGHLTFGCDMNPLAAKIAKAKVGILEMNPDVVREAFGTLVKMIDQAPHHLPEEREQFDKDCLDEISRWFPLPVVNKLNWLLRAIRGVSEGVIRDFFEVVLSSIIRGVSQQEPTDLRIRKRKTMIQDADVFEMFLNSLDMQYGRIERFWTIRGYSPNKFNPCKAVEGDSRDKATFGRLGINESSIDLVLTSPPYATALPYIDTDRLSLLVLFGMDTTNRRPIEHGLIGSREITTSERKRFEDAIFEDAISDDLTGLPKTVRGYLEDLLNRVSAANVGFRRKNMPALLQRFFRDMTSVLDNCYRVLRSGGEAMIVVGDNRMQVNGDFERIRTTDFIEEIALHRGFKLMERIDISVVTENLVHIKNAIAENVVLRLSRPK